MFCLRSSGSGVNSCDDCLPSRSPSGKRGRETVFSNIIGMISRLSSERERER